MGAHQSRTFGVKLGNVPHLNLRWEFAEYYRRSHQRHFLRQPDGKVYALRTRYLSWGGMPDAGASIMLCRSLLGIESYVTGAVHFSATAQLLGSPRFKKAVANPFSLGGGTADNFFNRLPALVSLDFAMRTFDAQLWEGTDALYREVRNPLFHGHELSDCTDAQFAALFDHLASIYRWIDSWYDADLVMKGAKQSFAL